MNITLPENCSLSSESIVIAPSSTDMCTSCPQACITPSFFDLKSRFVFSQIGRASISALNATHLFAGLPSTNPQMPCPAMSLRNDTPCNLPR